MLSLAQHAGRNAPLGCAERLPPYRAVASATPAGPAAAAGPCLPIGLAGPSFFWTRSGVLPREPLAASPSSPPAAPRSSVAASAAPIEHVSAPLAAAATSGAAVAAPLVYGSVSGAAGAALSQPAGASLASASGSAVQTSVINPSTTAIGGAVASSLGSVTVTQPCAPPAWAWLAPWVTIAAALCAGLAFLAVRDAASKTEAPRVLAAPTPSNAAILSRCPKLTKEQYVCCPGLTNGHVETIFAAKFRHAPHVAYRRELLAMPDGGTVALDWSQDPDAQALPQDAPVLVLFPGLSGGSGDTYVRWSVVYAQRNGIRPVVFNARGTADAPVTTPQFYSASFTGDARGVINHVAQSFPDSLLFATGWSLGGNILINYLGEEGENTPVDAAVSMCNPFNLTISNANLTQGFNKVYDTNIASALSAIFNKHDKLFVGLEQFDTEKAANCKTIREFDEAITSSSFDWDCVDEYYEASGSFLNVPNVKVPMLCIQALDDPIAPKEAIPYEALGANEQIILATTNTGGHLGWVAGGGAPFAEPWTDAAVIEYYNSVQVELLKQRMAPTHVRARADAMAASAKIALSAQQGLFRAWVQAVQVLMAERNLALSESTA